MIPILLNRLAVAPAADFVVTLRELSQSVFHQGTLFPSTPPATAFLIDLLPQLAVPERKAIYSMLWEIVTSAGYSLRPGHVHVPGNAGGPPELASDIRVIIDTGRPRFEPDCIHPDTTLRRAATHLTLAFPGAPADVLQRAAERYSSEVSPPVRREILLGVLRSRSAFPNWPAFLESALNQETPTNRFLLRFAQVLDAGPATEPAVVDDLVTTLIASLSHDVIRSTMEGNELTWFLEAVTALGPDRQHQALLAALRRSQKEGLALSLARHSLALVFADMREGWRLSYSSVPTPGTALATPPDGEGVILQALAHTLTARLAHASKTSSLPATRSIQYSQVTGPPPTIPASLTPAQRLALETIANHPPLWGFKTNLWSLYQLPDSPEALRAFLTSHA